MFATLRTHTLRTILRIVTILVVGILWLYALPSVAFFWSLFLIWAVWSLDTRMIGGGAIALLVLIPITLSRPEWEWVSEQLAVYVYFLLCITVGLQMIEMWSTRSADVNNDDLEVEESSAVDHTPPREEVVHETVHAQHAQATAQRQPRVKQSIAKGTARAPRRTARTRRTSPHSLDLRPQSRRFRP